eukprot:s4362_g4.t1
MISQIPQIFVVLKPPSLPHQPRSAQGPLPGPFPASRALTKSITPTLLPGGGFADRPQSGKQSLDLEPAKALKTSPGRTIFSEAQDEAWCLSTMTGTTSDSKLSRSSTIDVAGDLMEERGPPAVVGEQTSFDMEDIEDVAGLPVLVNKRRSICRELRFFLAVEHPMAVTKATKISGPQWMDAWGGIQHLKTLAKPTEEVPWEYGFVMGTFQEVSQARRAFLAYLHAERPGRRSPMDSFLWDDGWDDPHSLWEFDHERFPARFDEVSKKAKDYGAGTGVWLSPWGGYGFTQEARVKFGKKKGYETNYNRNIQSEGFSLAGKKYQKAFHDTAMRFRREQGFRENL